MRVLMRASINAAICPCSGAVTGLLVVALGLGGFASTQIFRTNQIADSLIVVRIPGEHLLHQSYSVVTLAKPELRQDNAMCRAQKGAVFQEAPFDRTGVTGGDRTLSHLQTLKAGLQCKLGLAFFHERIAKMGMAVAQVDANPVRSR